MTRRLPIVPTILVSAAVAAMIALGLWQVRRAHWKEGLLRQYAAAQERPPIAFPTGPAKADLPLFRRATGLCLKVAGWRSAAGENGAGESGFTFLADCLTGLEGPGMTVEAGWSKNPNARVAWRGGPVTGVIAPDRRSRLRLVSATGLGGLEASSPPSTATIPNNHRFYAIQWFLFAFLAALIYALALRKKWREAGQ